LSVIDKGGVIEVRQLKKMDGPDITIKVPKGVKIIYSHTSPYGGDIRLRNVEGPIEISTVHNNVFVENAMGPVNIKTVHGDIEASFTDASKNEIEIESVHGPVSVTMPVSTKANLKMGTVYGEMFVDPDFKLDIEKKGDFTKYNDTISAKL